MATNTPLPLATLRRKMLALTSYYETSTTEPDNFGVTAGNFDGAGLSWGAIQFNFGLIESHNTLSPIWRDLITNHPTVTRGSFSNQADYDYWRNLIISNIYANLKNFGKSITDPTNKHKVIEPWKTNFMNLGRTQEAQDRQVQGVKKYFDLAEDWKNEFRLWSRRGYALLFDIAVQSESIAKETKDLIKADFTELSPTLSREQLETEKMRIIANRRADAVSSRWKASYRERKLAIANGSGYVYGGDLFMDTSKYDIVLEPAFESDIYVPAH
ncbi:peptidoglycan-binding protein [Bacillus thuringiensis]|uniref:peptidoglycan-binding protein n=1 Tax=Bacillus thuringiensis TaxID=1428 RepID=UPI000BED7A48|nr:peptidoglycan-binding protein [Bacillus thuringiensis]PEB72716.1 peptidoglycan-binding protein [Bacillus thuringiensis]